MMTLHGQAVSRGVALGKLVFYRRERVCTDRRSISDADAEAERFEAARLRAYSQLGSLYEETLSKLGEENAVLFQIHQMILDDPDFCESVVHTIREQSVCAEYAVDTAAAAFSAAFRAMDDPYMQSRAADVADVAERVLRLLGGVEESALSSGDPFILAADDLAPSETARLDRSRVLAFVTSGGAENSHSAIFARTMGIPAVVGLGEALFSLPENAQAAVDGCSGTLLIEPDEAALAALETTRRAEDCRRAGAEHFRGKPTRSRSGKSVTLCANVGSPADVAAALAGDAEGVGLFRSEFLYLQRDDFPDEETQLAAYRAVAEQMGERQTVIRTLDIGADKQAAYFHLANEENPAMGLRAIRLCLTRPDIFRTQLRALYRASVYGNLAVMFPMITSLSELQACKAAAASVRDELRAEGLPFRENLPLGIMIETPAAALLSAELAREADFFSVGTNDLTQYTLAIDRQNSAAAAFLDPEHKAVLQLIALAAKSAHEAGIWIGICGELGADERLTARFLELGIDELSVTPSAILPLRARIAELD